MNIEHYWPDVPERAFTILRQIAAEVQVHMAAELRNPSLATPRDIVDCAEEQVRAWVGDADRRTLIVAAALLVRAINDIDERAAAKIDAPIPPTEYARSKLIRGR